MVATKLSLKSLARRILDINDEIAELDRFIVPLVEELAPSLLELEGVGTENAGAVMVAVGDNPDRLRSEASFAMMCGVCPIPASSGKTQRHRLNRGGNRQPRLRDRGDGAIRFTSAILPRYLRRAKSLEDLLPWLYRQRIPAPSDPSNTGTAIHRDLVR